jgi:putative SOS response-associated peptidase YedK
VCGRFTLTSTPEELARRFGLDETPALAPRYNIAPGQDVLVVRTAGETGGRSASPLRWGLVPSWAKSPSVGNRMINARAETLASKPAFRVALRRRRCLVLADGFYEWAKRGTVKQPYHIGLRKGAPFGFAGLWEHWSDPDGAVLESCTIVTTDASAAIRDIHPRMPVILAPEAEAEWLDAAQSDPDALLPLLRPLPDEALAFHAVSDRVNRPGFDEPACLEPVPEIPRQASLL